MAYFCVSKYKKLQQRSDFVDMSKVQISGGWLQK